MDILDVLCAADKGQNVKMDELGICMAANPQYSNSRKLKLVHISDTIQNQRGNM